MKKILLTICITFAVAVSVQSQEIAKNAIGLRFGANNGFGAEASYQHRLSSENRLEVNLGFRGNNTYNAFKATGLYQWVWQLEDRFNWYAGVGGGLGNWTVKATNSVAKNSKAFFFGSGIIGVEYHFEEVPILISLDFRPEIGFSDYYSGFSSDLGLSIRYKF